MMAWAFVAEYDLGFTNLIGEPSEVAEFYTRESGQPFRGTPSVLVFSPTGELEGAGAGAVDLRRIEAFIQQF